MATILVAEDRDVDRQFLATLLAYFGHSVIQAVDGADALDRLTKEPADLVISDVLMPTMDGFEFVRRLREVPGRSYTPVILYTASYNERETRALAARCGVSEVIIKPAEPAAIIAKVDAVLGGTSVAISPYPDVAFEREQRRLTSDVLVEKVRQLEATEQRLTAIVALGQHLLSQPESVLVLEEACKGAREATLAQHAVIGIVNDDRTAVALFRASGAVPASVGRIGAAMLGGPLLKPILDECKSVRRTNPSGDPEPLGMPAGHPPVRSFLGVPIASGGRVYGWIGLRNKLSADEFNETDEDLARTIGAFAGIAYENGSLVHALKDQADRLRTNEERIEMAMRAARMGSWQIDLDTGEIAAAASLNELFGRSMDDYTGSVDGMFQYVHADDQAWVRETMERAMRDRTGMALECRIVRPDGGVRWIHSVGEISGARDGRKERLVGLTMDITERRLLEAQFRQAQKMEAVGQLAGGVAHDFNNLLTAILGYSRFLSEGMIDDEQRRDVEEIIKAGERASTLTKQLLTFSRQQVVETTHVDVNVLVADLANMLQRLIGEQIEMTTTLEPGLSYVRADRGQIEQVLVNLVVNARDAMPKGGRLSIETSSVQLDQTYLVRSGVVKPGAYLMLAVGDDGSGMTEEVQAHIFEPFYSTKGRDKGTGLGLATVYGIVYRSGGYISVYSEPGLGTTFKIYLPVAGQDAGRSQGVAIIHEERTGGGTGVVLLVEDEEPVRRLACAILERAGYQVVDAANPVQAEAAFARLSGVVDLLVTDVIMPGGTGTDLFQRLVARRPELRAVFMSGYTGNTTVIPHAFHAAASFLEKPFTADGLVRKVREVLDR